MDFALGSVTSVMLATVTAVPLLPVQSFCIGAIVVAAAFDSGHLFFFAMLALVATSISATLMAQRSRYYRLYLDTLQTAGDLREFQIEGNARGELRHHGPHDGGAGARA